MSFEAYKEEMQKIREKERQKREQKKEKKEYIRKPQILKENIVSLTEDQIAAMHRIIEAINAAGFDGSERLTKMIESLSDCCHQYDLPSPTQLFEKWKEKTKPQLTATEIGFAKDVATYILSKPRLHRLLEYKVDTLEAARRYVEANRVMFSA